VLLADRHTTDARSWIVTRRSKVLIGVVSTVALLVVGGGVAFLALRDSGPDAATSEGAVAVLDNRQAESDPGGAQPEPQPEPQTADGVWDVDSSVGVAEYPFDDRSYVGYRVDEELAGIGGNTVVGRTPVVDGSLTITGTQIADVSVVADVRQLESDSSGRDSSLQDQALETNTFPEASFRLTTSIELGSIPADGVTIAVDATGELSLHGVTRPVTVPLEATMVGDTIAVVGRASIAFADYDIEAPTAALVVSVEEIGELELQLFFTRAGTASAG
jgi:polyisoprenoid-binding protein YceI